MTQENFTVNSHGAAFRGKALTRFGGLVAVNNVSFTVNKTRFFGLIGPNGAGKTTLFNLITGLLQPSSGQLLSR